VSELIGSKAEVPVAGDVGALNLPNRTISAADVLLSSVSGELLLAS
jgi:hypothetical protein